MADNPWGSGGNKDPNYYINNYGGNSYGNSGQSFGNKYSGKGFATKFFNKWSAGGSIASKYLPKISLGNLFGAGTGGGNEPFEKELNAFRIKGGSPFKIEKVTMSDGIVECRIQCILYLTTVDGFLNQGHLDYRNAFYSNIMAVWGNIGNTYLEDSKTHRLIIDSSPKFNVLLLGSWSDGINPSPDATILRELSGSSPSSVKMENNEDLLLMQTVVQRSFIRGDRRTGVMNTADLGNTPSHEFGHILGLSDRYNYFHLAYKSDSKVNKLPVSEYTVTYNDPEPGHGHANVNTGTVHDRFSNPFPGDGTDLSGNTTRELPLTNHTFRHIDDGDDLPSAEPYYQGDEEYGHDRNWTKNLMSAIGNGLTTFQMKLVCQEKKERNYQQWTFIKNVDTTTTPDTFKPSFVGLNGRNVVHDAFSGSVNNIPDAESKAKQQKFQYLNPFRDGLEESYFYDENYSEDQEKKDLITYNGKLRKAIIESVRQEKLVEIKERIITALNAMGNSDQFHGGTQQYVDAGKQFPVNMPTKYNNIKTYNNTDFTVWNGYLVENYYHYMFLEFNWTEFQTKAENGGWDGNLEGYVRNVYDNLEDGNNGIDRTFRGPNGGSTIRSGFFQIYVVGNMTDNNSVDNTNIQKFINRQKIIQRYLFGS